MGKSKVMQTLSINRLIAMTIIILGLIAYSYSIRFSRHEESYLPDLENTPAEISGYTSEERALPQEEIKVLGVDESLVRIYRNDKGNKITLLIGYFKTQQENSQIHSPKHCYPGSGWNVAKEGNITITLSGNKVGVKYLVISNGRQRRLVLYWFESVDKIITNEFALKWNEMKNALLGKPQGVAFVRFSTDITDQIDFEETLKELGDFAEKSSERIKNIITTKGE